MHQAVGVGVKVHQPAASFRRRAVPLVTETRFHLKPRRYLVVVGYKGAGRVLKNPAVDLRGRHGKSTGSPVDEVSCRTECNGARGLTEGISDEPAKFTPKFDRVLSPAPRKGVGKHARGIEAALGKSRRTPKIKTDVLHRDLGQGIVVGHAVLDAVVQGIFRCVGNKRDGDTVEAQARLVHDTRREDVYLIERADLPVRGTVIPKAWNRVELQHG